MDNGHHALFREKWERCKTCIYDPENNKKCPDYSPGTYCFDGGNQLYEQSQSQPNSGEVRA